MGYSRGPQPLGQGLVLGCGSFGTGLEMKKINLSGIKPVHCTKKGWGTLGYRIQQPLD